jgi:geranylgeranyl pyrophosphate synthase
MGNRLIETADIYEPVAADIPQVGLRLQELSSGHHPLLGEALAHVLDTAGKRIRPALVMLSGKLGRYDIEALVTLAAALEVVHTATLVHDDTIDEAVTRRGLKTVNAVWDGKIAILVGDFLFAQSAYLAAQLNSVPIVELLSETVMAMSSGELRQYSSSQDRTLDEADYFQRIGGKTASLFAACCQGAAIVSGQSKSQIESLRTYGLNLGVAFQIADDVLDFSSDEATLGKPVGSDLSQGTITLPVILLAERLPKDDRLLQHIRNGTSTVEVVEAVRTSSAIVDALNRAREYSHTAQAALEDFPPSEAKDALLSLAAYVIDRRR